MSRSIKSARTGPAYTPRDASQARPRGGRAPEPTRTFPCGFSKDIAMIRRALKFALLPAVFVAGIASAQYPVLDAVANRVIDKYKSASCEQLWQNRCNMASEYDQRVLLFLREDPQMRQYFFNKIAGPVMNKMFDCGMIP
jgi:hypothetical protein